MADGHVLVTKLSVALVLVTLGIFLPVVNLNWVNYDDDVFVTNNPMVAPGFTWAGVKWAFTAADIDYWRPLSWLSHMLDIELFGVAAGLHHLVNLLIHVAAAVLCLLAFHRMTGEVWPSALVAALFAWHPLHVESVAWIAERKDVLCGFFWHFTLWAYARHVERPGARRYALVCAGFLLGLMSKPMMVTLPCVLLLLDHWPLRRLEAIHEGTPPGRGPDWLGGLGRLAWEKAPLFAGSLVLAGATVLSQHRVGTMSGLAGIPLAERAANALAGYGTYLGQTFLPVNLCVLYPLPAEGVATWQWLGSGAIIALLLAAGLRWATAHPFVLVGWLWFLGVLVPVSGLVQVGEQAHADRYTYLPLTGVFLMIAWAGWRWARGCRVRLRVAGWLAGGVLLACAVVTRQQLRHWEHAGALFQRALAVTTGNTTAMNNYASDLMAVGRLDEAVAHLNEAIRVHPHQQQPQFNLGHIYAAQGNPEQALNVMTHAFALDPTSTTAEEQLAGLMGSLAANPADELKRRIVARAHSARGDYVSAASQLAEVLRHKPDDVPARIEFAAYVASSGRIDEAIVNMNELVQTHPADAMVRRRLGALLSRAGRLGEAANHLRAALASEPANLENHLALANVLTRIGRIQEARQLLEAALDSNPRFPPAQWQLAWLLATRAECRNGSEALRLANRAMESSSVKTADQLDTLAAAHAAAGEFERASVIMTQVLRVKPPTDPAQRLAMQERLRLYRIRQVYTEPDAGTQ